MIKTDHPKTSSEFFTASNSFTNPSVSEISKISPTDFDISHEDSMTTMNVIYENEKVVTKAMNSPDIFENDIIPEMNGNDSDKDSTPKILKKRDFNSFTPTDWENAGRNDLWTILERIMGTTGSQESIASGKYVKT